MTWSMWSQSISMIDDLRMGIAESDLDSSARVAATRMRN